jgi:hypothetical protein
MRRKGVLFTREEKILSAFLGVRVSEHCVWASQVVELTILLNLDLYEQIHHGYETLILLPSQLSTL